MGQEKTFEKKIKQFLDENNCWHVKFFANAYTRKGVPDLLCCINGFFVAIEVKKEDGKATDLQKWNMSKIKRAGGIGIILRPSQFEEFKTVVKKLLRDKHETRKEEV